MGGWGVRLEALTTSWTQALSRGLNLGMVGGWKSVRGEPLGEPRREAVVHEADVRASVVQNEGTGSVGLSQARMSVFWPARVANMRHV